MKGNPRDPFKQKVLATAGAEGPKKRMIRPSRPTPQQRGEGTTPPRKRSVMEVTYANTRGSEGPKRSVERGRTTRLGSEGPKRNPSTTRRQEQNLGVKGGTMRRGRAGKTMRKYNAKTGRWDVVSMTGKYK